MNRLKYSYIVLIFLLFSLACFSQINDIQFVSEKIQNDYPGFYDKTNILQYRSLVDSLIKVGKNDTFQIISNIAFSFNDQHLRIVGANKPYQDSTFYRIQKNKIETNLKSTKKKNSLEGFWMDDDHESVIGIVKDSDSRYLMYVMEVSTGNLIPGQLKGILVNTKDNDWISPMYTNSTGKMTSLTVKIRNDTIFTVGGVNKWRKLNIFNDGLIYKYKAYTSNVQGKVLSKKTYLITIPSCSEKNVIQIDSLIKFDYELIKKSENLIIDIRGNNGGKSRIYSNILPLVYTGPYLNISSSVFCSPDGISNEKQILENLLINKYDSSYIEVYKKLIKEMEDSLGRFIYHAPDTIKYDSILSNPKNIGIIMDYGSQSAAEMLVLMCRHSTKVCLFGENTIGALDYLSFYTIDCPSGKYHLYMPLTKRYITCKHDKLDGIGIRPDLVISDTVKDWVEYVRNYYEK